ncbi:MAG: hypothetical protein FH749_00845 [Firmicutes bacterium]|nr:hypothetical protein [Bacillota bacterium]
MIDFEISGSRVHSLICRNHKVFSADYFIAACDAHHFYISLLKGKHLDRAFKKRFDNPQAYPLASSIYVGMRLEDSLTDVPQTLNFPVNSFRINSRLIDRLTITHYSYDPSFAPPGHSVITCDIHQFHGEFDAWNELYTERQAYQQEVDRIGKQVREAIE